MIISIQVSDFQGFEWEDEVKYIAKEMNHVLFADVGQDEEGDQLGEDGREGGADAVGDRHAGLGRHQRRHGQVGQHGRHLQGRREGARPRHGDGARQGGAQRHPAQDELDPAHEEAQVHLHHQEAHGHEDHQ